MSYTSPIFAELEKDPNFGRYIDCGFNDPSVNTEGFALATSPEVMARGSSAPVLEDKDGFSVIHKSEWPDRVEEMDQSGGGLERFIVWTYNQGREGTCTSNQECQKGNVIDAIQFGKENVVVRAPISIYMEVAPGPGTGSSVGENLVQHRNVGALPINNARNKKIIGDDLWEEKHALSATGYSKSKYKDGWKVYARQFKLDEYYEIATPEAFVTALFLGWPVGYGRQGHSILALRPVMKNGIVYVLYINSWGEWGIVIDGRKAYGLDSPSQYGTGAKRYGCNCACSSVVPQWQRAELEKDSTAHSQGGEIAVDNNEDPAVPII